MQELRFRKTLIHSAILSVFCSLPAAYAAEPAADPDTPEDIETVTITVDQRQVNLQEAALSVTAVNSDLMEQANITDATDLNGYVPGLQINKSGGSERMVSIRGVGSQTPENFFSHPGVSFHMDGAYITNNIALNMGFLDVEHI